MGCCGKRRASLVTPKPSPEPVENPTRVELLRREPTVVRGPVTGRHYSFVEGAYTQAIDPRDIPALVATGYFVPRA